MFDKLPYFVTINNKKYKINVDFRRIISIEDKIQSRDSKEEIVEYTLGNFYSDFYYIKPSTELYKKLLDKFIWFYKCGKEDYHPSGKGTTKQSDIYDYEADEFLIYSAFMQQYKIDLFYVKHLHWWKFKALLDGLNDSTEFVKIKSYRAYNGKDKQMLELKEYWKLPQDKGEKERLQRIYDALK